MLNPGWPSTGSLPSSINGDHEWSNSSWAEMESQVIGHFPIYPLTKTAQQVSPVANIINILRS